MRIVHYGDRAEACVFLLGYFDAVHVGHRKLIARAKALAEKFGVKVAALTFADGKRGDQVYVLSEREKILSSLGVDYLYVARFDGAFKNTGGEAFLETVADNCFVKAFVCGEDFRFGKNAVCGGLCLTEYCKKRGIAVEILPLVSVDGQKASATLAKKYLDEGDIKSLNAMLGDNYFISGKASTEGRHVGRNLGFPTANLHPLDGKYPLAQGVYAVRVKIGATDYRGIANFGPRPTFGDGRVVCETYIDGFSGDLYGKELTVRFDFRIRGVMKFSSAEELKKQLEKDLEKIR